jgi:hypothetical protein
MTTLLEKAFAEAAKLSPPEQDPSHPGLRFEQVHADPPMYSARVGIRYRAVGALEGNASAAARASGGWRWARCKGAST